MNNAEYTTVSHTNITRDVSRWERVLYDVRASQSPAMKQATDGLRAVLQSRTIDPKADHRTELRRVDRLAVGASAEVFAALYSGSPVALEYPAPDSEWVRTLHEQLEQLPEHQALAANVNGDPDLAAIAAAKLIEQALAHLPAMIGSDKKEEPKSKEDRQAARKDRRNKANGPSAGQQLRAALRAACTAASQEAAECRAALGGLAPGLDAAPAMHEADSAARMMLAERLRDDKKLRRAMLLAGRLRRVSASTRKERDPQGCEQLVGITQGADLPRVLPVELGMMRNPITRTHQLAKLAERKLSQYRLVGETPKGRGPVVVLLDESGSMRNDDRHVWAAAVALACLGHAAREARPCTVIGFNEGVRYVLRLDAKGNAVEHDKRRVDCTTRLPGGCAEIAMRVATSSPYGGTSFAPPVLAALDLEDGVIKDRADLVLVTDGQADLPHGIIDRLDSAKAKGLRIFGLTIGGGSLGRAVSHLCDHVADLDSCDTKAVAHALP